MLCLLKLLPFNVKKLTQRFVQTWGIFSDVIKDSVLENKDKDKDMKPEDEDEDKDLQKQQKQGQGLGTKDKAEDLRPSLRPRPKNSTSKQITSKRPYHNDTLPSTRVTLVRFCTF